MRRECPGAIGVGLGALVLFTLTGLSNLTDGTCVQVMTFMTQHKLYLWLTEVIAVGVGSIDETAGALTMRYYYCHVGHRPDLTARQLPR